MSTHESDLVIQNITSYVREAVKSWDEDAAIQSTIPEIVIRPWSFMLRYSLEKNTGERSAVLVKVARHKKMELAISVNESSLLARTEREFEMLNSIAHVFQQNNGINGFCFVRPLEILPQWNALVMEELESHTLKALILKPRMIFGLKRDWKMIETLMTQATRWLRKYHNGMGEVQETSLRESSLHDRIGHIVARLSAHVPEHTLKPVRDRLLKNTEKLADNKVVIAMLHNDFHSGNILVTPDGLVGALDADVARGPVYQDVAKFFADLKTRSIQMLTRGGFIRSGQLAHCRQAIVHGYFEPGEFNERLFNLFVSVAILEKWMIDEDASVQLSGIKNTLFKALTVWRRNYFLSLLRKQME